MDKRIVAISIVAIMIIAVAGATLALGNDDKSTNNIEVDASLSVCGNANGDYRIDQQDLDIINDIINGKRVAADYPLADANHDSKVDQADYDFVKSMIDKKNTYVYVYDDSQKFVKVNYPVTKTVVVGTNPITTAILIGAADCILGYTSTSYPEIHKPIIDNSRKLGGTIGDLNTDEAMANFMDLDTKCGGLDAVIALPSYLKKSTALIEKAEIPIVRLDPRYGWDSISGALTMGYLFGETCEKRSQQFAEMTFSMLSDINKKLEQVTSKKTYLAVAAGNSIGQLDSAYNKVCDFAGGSPIANLPGSSAEAIEQGSEGYKNYKPDYIISFRTLDYSVDWTHAVTGKVTSPQDEWNKYKAYWQDMDCYKNLVYVNLAMPVIAQIAYVAETFYPELFEEGYADSIHQKIVNQFMEYLGNGFDVSKDMTTIFGYEDVKH